MEKKILILGIGIGLIISSSLFYIFYTIVKNNEVKVEISTESNSINNSDKIDELLTNKNIKDESSDVDEIVGEVNETQSPISTENIEETIESIEVVEGDKILEEVELEDLNQEVEVQEYVFFEIKQDTPEVTIIENLYNAKVIDNVELFTQYLSENNYRKKLRYGKYNLPKNGSYEEIAKILLNI